MKVRARENIAEQLRASISEPKQVSFDAAAFPILVVQKACHRLSHLASFDICQVGEASKILVSIYSKVKDPELLAQSLRDEVLDQRMREVVRKETEGVRNLILAHAFSRTGLISNDPTTEEIE